MKNKGVFDMLLNSSGVYVDFTKEERAIIEKFVSEHELPGNLSDYIRSVVMADIEDYNECEAGREE